METLNRRVTARRWSLGLSIALFLLFPGRASATVGFAEWEITTPGGYTIAHGDEWKNEYGDCLLAPGAQHPLVARLVRWRYYTGYVVGETDTDFFLLQEKTGSVTRYPRERALAGAIRKRIAGAPLSGWLHAEDGWTEAWFPLMIWPRCKDAPDPPLPEIKAMCDRFLSPKGLALLRLTTWGRQCAALAARKDAPPGPDGGDAARAIQDWCKLVAGNRESKVR